MSDFDDLLERLVLDPDFKAALAADPDGVLRGYRLDADQRRVLLTQVSTETGTGLKVEERISKAGMAGLLSAFTEGAGGFSQHTMQGVHTVAPSAHGPTISAGAIQHAFDSGAPAVDTAPTGPPGQSMAGAFAAIQNAMEHINQTQATGMGGPVGRRRRPAVRSTDWRPHCRTRSTTSTRPRPPPGAAPRPAASPAASAPSTDWRPHCRTPSTTSTRPRPAPPEARRAGPQDPTRPGTWPPAASSRQAQAARSPRTSTGTCSSPAAVARVRPRWERR